MEQETLLTGSVETVVAVVEEGTVGSPEHFHRHYYYCLWNCYY